MYDSNYGNTKIIAGIVAQELGAAARSVDVSDFNLSDLAGLDLLIVGSPIIAWKPTEKIKDFLDLLSKQKFNHLLSAAFDTRIKLFISGNAAKRIGEALKQCGAKLIDKPIGFYVQGKEGPLMDGETARAREWARSLPGKI